MPSPKIKICGLLTTEMADFAIRQGADFIGLVFHPRSSRNITDLNQARLISEVAHEQGSSAVAIFVNQEVKEMQHICDYANINTVQLHGARAKKQHQQLDPAIRRIYVIAVEANGTYEMPELHGLDPQRDFLLFDYKLPGSGQAFSHRNFSYHGEFDFFIAGGLSANNVKNCLKQTKPYALDVSSGVEIQPGRKDKNLIKQFIESVRHDQ